MNQTNQKIRRELTAMSRPALSLPIQIALEKGIIRSGVSVFDYGCGRGGDVARLKKKRVKAGGWDPYYFPDSPKNPADVVNFGYVANVIENPRERAAALREAWELTRKTLIVSARGHSELKNLSTYEVYGDGVVTSRGTFQKFYTFKQLDDWVKRHTGVRAQETRGGSSELVFFVHRQ